MQVFWEVSMKIRRRTLPGGWYPESEEQVRFSLQEYAEKYSSPSKEGLAGIAPHAGWFFSGELAFRVVSSLAPAETCVVIGGHLGSWDSIHLYPHDAFETPLGLIERDSVLVEKIRKEFSVTWSDDTDNTVEIQLPLIKYCFPAIRVVCLRCPPNEEAIRLGKYLAGEYRECGRSLTLLASTDLTHYGPNYGFMPKGIGDKALHWVREENDRVFLDAAIRADPEGLLSHAQKNGAACSAGAAAVAASFAKELNLKGLLIGYGTSWDKHPSPSFVGYGAVIYR